MHRVFGLTRFFIQYSVENDDLSKKKLRVSDLQPLLLILSG